MRLIIRGDKSSAMKYIGFAKARLRDMRNIMGALGLNYNRKHYRLSDAELVVESRYGLDTAWIVGRGIRVINDEFLPDTLSILVSLLIPSISTLASQLGIPVYSYREREVSGGLLSQVHIDFKAEPWGAWTGTDDISHPPYYLRKTTSITPRIFTFKGRELKIVITIPPLGTWSAQAKAQAAPEPDGGSKTYLESEPSRSGIITALDVWQDMFTLTGADAGTQTIITTDKNAWDLGNTFTLGILWKGWQGHDDGALRIV